MMIGTIGHLELAGLAATYASTCRTRSISVESKRRLQPWFMVGTDPFFYTRRVQLTTLATRHALPAVYNVRE